MSGNILSFFPPNSPGSHSSVTVLDASKPLFLAQVVLLSGVGVQNEPSPTVPQWYADFFELEAVLASCLRETRPLPLNTVYKAGQISIYWMSVFLTTLHWALEVPWCITSSLAQMSYAPRSPFVSLNFSHMCMSDLLVHAGFPYICMY